MHVAPVVRRLSDGTDSEASTDARTSVLEADPQGVITKIGSDSVARRFGDARCTGETVKSEPAQVSLQHNSEAEGDAVSAAKQSGFNRRRAFNRA